ncbi:MAG: hypothetical protein B6D64_13030 [Bacteroidetes bacterium 4484_276]|nr:MAG: hypothetical protein B6D64_13030 [Bacteroidetes bacterium 4484_276]
MKFKLLTVLIAGMFLAVSFQSDAQKSNILIEKGLAYLASTQSTSKGFDAMGGTSIDPNAIPNFDSKAVGDWGGAGISALALQAFLQNGHNIDDPVYGTVVTNAITYILSMQYTSGYHTGAFGNWSVGYETGMCIEALNMALNLPLSGGGGKPDPLKTQLENAIALGVNYYTQDINETWSRVSWRYDRGYTSTSSGDMSVNQWVYLALDAAGYTDKDVWNKIYTYLHDYKCASGAGSRIGYQNCNTRPQGMSCAGCWGAVLAGDHSVAAAPALADEFYNYLDGFSLAQLINSSSIGSNQIYVGGGYFYYLYGFAKAMVLGNKTIFGTDNGPWYEFMYNAIESYHGTDGNGNYYWDNWGGQGTNMETALALLCLQVREVPEGSKMVVSLDTDPNGKDDCLGFTIYDEVGNAAGKNEGNWYTNIPNSEWTSTTGDFYELTVDLEESANFSVEITNTCLDPQVSELCFKTYLLDELKDEECYLLEDQAYLVTIGATAFVNAIGGLNIIIVVPPTPIPVMELDPAVIAFNPFEYDHLYEFSFNVMETGGETPLSDIDLFASDLVDQYANVVPAANFTLTPSHIDAILPGEFVTVQGTVTTPASFTKADFGLFQGNITAQTGDQTKGINFEIGAPEMTIDPVTALVPSTSGSTAFDISFAGLQEIGWSIDFAETWITAVPMAGNGDATVTVNYAANPAPVERVAVLTITAPDADNTEATFTITQEASTSTADQVITLEAGWLGVSSYILPEAPALEVVLAGIEDQMEIMLSSSGFYWPSHNINLIGDWDTYLGYKIKMNEPTVLEMFGVPAETSVTFPAGVNYLPVLVPDPVAAADVLDLASGALLYAFNIQDQLVYWPGGGIATLETLEPGIGYLLWLTDEATFNFAGKTTAGPQQVQPFVNTTTWNDPINTGTPHIISINTSAMGNLVAGDVIGAFNSTGVCVGMAGYTDDKNNLSLVVNGQDVTSTANIGMADGEPISFKLYNVANGETNLSVTFDPVFNTGTFEAMGVSMITDMKAGALGIGTNTVDFNIYPNPSNGVFNIQSDAANITVINSQGQIVHQATIAGSSTLDLSHLGQGIYYIRVVNKTGLTVEKIAIK